ncbi:hypothetical protein QYM36_006165 [Artemia franciscana]|uniref:3CxxC-type domain-containing protein n=1 Tax=Artemia franciscana TaxID=6661 RepID=A0AA88IDJ8_ARTSF|nr:hypothetical protein QYM36_006165 [Artemia franciscana]
MATNLYFPPSGASAPQQMALPADTDEVVFVQEHLVTGQGFQIVNHSPPVVPVNQMITPQNSPYMSNSYANLKQGNQSCNNSSRNFSQLELGSEKSLLGLESGMENFPLNFSPDLIPRQGKGPSGNAIGSIMHSKCQPDFPGSANTELDLEAVIDSKTINGNFPVLQSDLIPYYWLLLGNKFGLTLKDLYPVPLRFLNLFMNPESQLYTHIDTAKVRFSCRRCRNGWTSMFGSIIFWFQKYDNHCRVFYHALGQKCAKCLKSDWTLENILKIEEPSWYPSETERVCTFFFFLFF